MFVEIVNLGLNYLEKKFSMKWIFYIKIIKIKFEQSIFLQILNSEIFYNMPLNQFFVIINK